MKPYNPNPKQFMQFRCFWLFNQVNQLSFIDKFVQLKLLSWLCIFSPGTV